MITYWNVWRTASLVAVLAGLLWFTTDRAVAQTNALNLTVRCQPAPEQVVVLNQTGAPITLVRLESSFGPKVPGEPADIRAQFPNLAVLADGQSVTFESGPGASGNVLFADRMFDEANLASESLVLTTDRGIYRLACGAGQNTQAFPVNASLPGDVPVSYTHLTLPTKRIV